MRSPDDSQGQQPVPPSSRSDLFSETPSRSDRPQSILSSGGYIPISYCPQVHDQATTHTAVIERTTDYNIALESAKAIFERHFPVGSAHNYRWLSVSIQRPDGSAWAEFSPDAFPAIVSEAGVELRLCEDATVTLNVSTLPIGHTLETEELRTYLELKVITIGPMSVGKSMMLQYFTKKEEQRQRTLPATIGAESEVTSRFITSDGELIKTTLWDTAGQEEYRSITRSLYRRTNGVFLVYSIASAQSFSACAEWLKEIRRNVDDETPIMLVGNQIDRRNEREVKASEARLFALQNNLLFIEISAMYGTNVDYAFRRLVHEIFSGLTEASRLNEFRKTKPAARPPLPQKSRCC